jgi:hypothetical protein
MTLWGRRSVLSSGQLHLVFFYLSCIAGLSLTAWRSGWLAGWQAGSGWLWLALAGSGLAALDRDHKAITKTIVTSAGHAQRNRTAAHSGGSCRRVRHQRSAARPVMSPKKKERQARGPSRNVPPKPQQSNTHTFKFRLFLAKNHQFHPKFKRI